MKRIIISIFIIFFIDYSIISFAEEDEYTPQDKFSRGIYNCVTFPLEIPITIHNTSKEKTPVIGLLYGLPLGVGKSIIRMSVGLVELVTFPFPPYEPIIEPEVLFLKKRE